MMRGGKRAWGRRSIGGWRGREIGYGTMFIILGSFALGYCALGRVYGVRGVVDTGAAAWACIVS